MNETGKVTVVSFGELLWDILPDARLLGGAPFNFAFRMHELTCFALMASRLGRDELGEAAFIQLERTGMDLRLVQWDRDHPTGTVNINFDCDNVADISVVADVAYDYIAPVPNLLREASTAKCICFGSVAQRSKPSRSTLYRMLDIAPDALKVYDINLRKGCYSLESIGSALERTNILKLNEHEVVEIARLFGFPNNGIADVCIEICRRFPVGYCLVTMEERGALAFSCEGEQFYSPGFAVDFVDPLGAGDAFTAGFVSEFLKGATIESSLSFGNLLGAAVVGQKGATQAVTRDDLDAISAAGTARLFDERFLATTRNEEYVCR